MPVTTPRSRTRRPAVATPAPLPDVAAPPLQDRSRQMLARIVAASRALLEERSFEQVSVADIAARAGVSVGVFYTRFSSKEHVLAHLTRELTPELYRRVETALSPGETGRLSMREIAERYFQLTAEAFVRHRAVFRPLSLLTRFEAHADLRALTATFNEGVHRLFRDRLLEHRTQVRHPDPVRAVDFAILASSAVIREVVLYGEPVSQLSRSQKDAVREAAHVCVAYLTSATPGPPRARRRTK